MGRPIVLLLTCLAAASAGEAATPWSLRRAAFKDKWKGARVALLWRGMHYGSYVSQRHRGKTMRVDGNHASVHANHMQKVLLPLARAGANVTVFACTHASDVVDEWRKSAKVDVADVIAPDDEGDKPLPNELLRRGYELVKRYDWDVLISARADLWLKRDVVSLLSSDPRARYRDNTRIRLPFREVHIHQSPRCQYREREPGTSCLHSWAKQKSRFSDAILVAPRDALPRIEAALESLIDHKVWDQHTLAWELAKAAPKTFDIDRNVSALVEGFWDSNVDKHANPLFGLARGSRFLDQLKKHDTGE